MAHGFVNHTPAHTGALTRNRIKRADFRHVSEIQHDLVVYRYAAADEPGVPALRNERDAPLVAPLHDLAHLRRRARA